MNVETKKLSLIQQILSIHDEALLDQIRQFLQFPQKGQFVGWDALSEAEKQALEEALIQSNAGEGRSHDEVMAELRAKYEA